MNTTSTLDQFFIMDGDQQRGPFSLDVMKNMWLNGTVTASTLYWQDGMDEWMPVAEISTWFAPQTRSEQIQAENARLRALGAMGLVSSAGGRADSGRAGPANFGLAMVLACLFPFIGFIFAVAYLVRQETSRAGITVLVISFCASLVWALLVMVMFR